MHSSFARIGAILAVIYVVFLFAVFLGQRKLMYLPSRAPMNELERQAKEQGMGPWLTSSGEFIGWKHQVRSNGLRALVVHGNAGSAVDRSYYIEALEGAGFGEVYVLEYPGYGARVGAPSQREILRAAGEGFDLLAAGGSVYVVGESLGTGVAAYLAGQNPKKTAGVLLVAPYNRMTEVARAHMPIVPVSLLLRDRYPATEYLSGYRGPVAVLLAGNDTVIPNRFGRKLYDEYAGPKKLWLIPNAGHNDVVLQPSGWWREVVGFWNGKK